MNHCEQLYTNSINYVSAAQGRTGGRAALIASFFLEEGDMRVDDNGYGTHVAGIIAGKAYGIAESAQVCSVKVFSSEKAGLNVTVMAALEWAVKDGAKHAREEGQAFCGG